MEPQEKAEKKAEKVEKAEKTEKVEKVEKAEKDGAHPSVSGGGNANALTVLVDFILSISGHPNCIHSLDAVGSLLFDVIKGPSQTKQCLA